MLHATIMAGGSGTRFWPASRADCPKQLLALAGDKTMMQATVGRLAGMVSPEQLLIITNRSLVDAICHQLPDVPVNRVLGEPCRRNTAPCVGLAAALVSAEDPDGTMVVMPADHLISPEEVFQQAIEHAVELVDEDPGRIITFGIPPTHAASSFGYIERGTDSHTGKKIPTYTVRQFHEKPSVDVARGYLDAGSFYWNSGIFVWKAATILSALEKYEPEMHARLQVIAEAIGTDSFEQVLDQEFAAIEGTSIDYAVMERHDNVLVVESPFQWDDVGNWQSLERIHGVDQQGNTIVGQHLGIDTSRSIIRGSPDHLVVTFGMDNCIIVHTDDATLVAHRDDEEAIRRIVQQLEEKGLDKYL
tara:strand:+ start:2784 stop:3863 length:1080 start_codon:yes stop_codon:yes gene_type:complete